MNTKQFCQRIGRSYVEKRMRMMRTISKKNGFTMIELLVALSILALLIVFLSLGQGLQLTRADDARRKADLARLKIAFEDYYNDKGCYPPPSLLQSCGSTDLAPYVGKVPCEPRTNKPYAYFVDPSCKWYAIFTTLGDTKDPIIPTLSCSPSCGVTGQLYNFAQTNGGQTLPAIISNINASSGGGGGGSPPGNGGGGGTSNQYACDPSGQCNAYDNPQVKGCPVTFTDPQVCQKACSDPSNRCTR